MPVACAGTVAHAELLRRAAQFVQGMLEVLGITTIGLHLNEELSVSSKTLLDVFKRFRDCVASAPQLEEVCFMPHKLSVAGREEILLI